MPPALPQRQCRVFVEIPTRRPSIPSSAVTNNPPPPMPSRTTEDIFRTTFPHGIDAWTIDCYFHRGAAPPDRRTIPSVVEDYMKDPVSCRIWVMKPKNNQQTYTLCLTIHMRIICNGQVICNTLSPRITLATYTGSRTDTLAPRWLHIATPGFSFYRDPVIMLSVAGTGAACESDVLRATDIVLWRSKIWSRKNQMRNKISRLLKHPNGKARTQDAASVCLLKQNQPDSSVSTNRISRVRAPNQWQKIRLDS